MDDKTARKELLLRLYDQLYNDINRHITVVWQSITVLIGGFAVFAFTEKGIITLDIATCLILLLSGWLLAHVLDAAYWYNRNLVMIANIDRQFLGETDLKEIHYYFGKHRPENKMLIHLRIQAALGLGVAVLILGYHFLTRVLPDLDAPWTNFELQRMLPYVFLILILPFLCWIRKHRNKSYAEFLKNSPGKQIDTSGIAYGVGHGFKDQNGGEEDTFEDDSK